MLCAEVAPSANSHEGKKGEDKEMDEKYSFGGTPRKSGVRIMNLLKLECVMMGANHGYYTWTAVTDT